MESYDIKTQELLNEIVAEYKEFDLEDIVKILPKLIVHFKLYKNKTADQKLDIIVNVLKYIVDKTDGPGNDELFDPIIKRLIPGMVNLLIEVDNGKIKLRRNKCIKYFCP
jgi:hypothetical protein